MEYFFITTIHRWSIELQLKNGANSKKTLPPKENSEESTNSDESAELGESSNSDGSAPLLTTVVSTTAQTIVEEVNIIDRHPSRQEHEDSLLDYDEEDLIELNPEAESIEPEDNSASLDTKLVIQPINILIHNPIFKDYWLTFNSATFKNVH